MSVILGHFPGGGKNTGMYIWSRYKVTTLYSEQNTTSKKTTIPDIGALQQTIQLYAGSSYTFDETTGKFTIVNPTIIDVTYGSSYAFSGAWYFTINSPTSDMMFQSYRTSNSSRKTYVYNMNNSVYVQAGNTGYPFTQYSQSSYQAFDFLEYVVADENEYPKGAIHTDGYFYDTALKGLYVWNKFKYADSTKGDWVDYVVSDNNSEYPNGAVHTDGYWYEISNTANLTVKTGTVTLGSSGYSSINVEAQLGKKPLYCGVSALDSAILPLDDGRGITHDFCAYVEVSFSGSTLEVSFSADKPNGYVAELNSLTFTWFAIG